jgi:hypothetical protein
MNSNQVLVYLRDYLIAGKPHNNNNNNNNSNNNNNINNKKNNFY